jgi:hypothetical protein
MPGRSATNAPFHELFVDAPFDELRARKPNETTHTESSILDASPVALAFHDLFDAEGLN